MKKILNFLCIALAAVTMVSCQGPAGRDGADGRPGKDGVITNRKVIDIDVAANQWSYSNVANNNYFYAVINVPEITWDVYDDAVIKMYREYETGTDKASQIELPYVKLIEYQDKTSGEWLFYQETVDYEFTQGSVTIFFTASDFMYELDDTINPEAMHFRLVMLW